MPLLPRTSCPTGLLGLVAFFLLLSSFVDGDINDGEKDPLVFVAVLARNAGYLLSNYFGYLEKLDYPKERIAVL